MFHRRLIFFSRKIRGNKILLHLLGLSEIHFYAITGKRGGGKARVLIKKRNLKDRSEYGTRKVGGNIFFDLEDGGIPWNSDRDPREIKTVEKWDPFRTTDSISCNPYPGGMPLEYSWFLLSAYRCKESRHKSRHSLYPRARFRFES